MYVGSYRVAGPERSPMSHQPKDYLPLLECFLGLVKCGEIAEAARRRNSPESEITQAISRLEAHIGVPLFERLAPDAVLTVAGRTYAQHVEPIVQEIHALFSTGPAGGDWDRGKLELDAPD